MAKRAKRRRKPPVSLSDVQLLALLGLAYADSIRNWVLILIAYWHGLRASEAVGLRESDIDLNEWTVQVFRGKGSEGGLQTLQEHDNPLLNERAAIKYWLANREQFGVKGGAKPGRKMQQSTQIVAFSTPCQNSHTDSSPSAPQSVPGGPEPLPSLEVALPTPSAPRSNPSERLFPIGRGQFWRIVHGYALAAGIPRRKCKTHMLKHTIAKHLVRAGHPLNEIQEWMGWTTIETMNWYTRADEEELGHRIGDTIRSKDGLRQIQQGTLFPSG